MNEKEKAKELVEKYIDIMPNLENQTGESILHHAKECAKIVAGQILEILCYSDCFYDVNYLIDYWNQVLKEIDLI